MGVDVTYQGGKFAQRGYDMYREVERLTPFQIFVSQGGYNVGGVSASAGTHDREAVDVSASLLTPDERWTVVTNMRRVGWAAWIRTPAQGFSYHVHGVPINGDLSVEARAQVWQYMNHYNGLAGRRLADGSIVYTPDDGPGGYYDMTWEKYKGNPAYRPPLDTSGKEEDDMFTDDDRKLLQDVKSLLTWAFDKTNGSGAAFPTAGYLTKVIEGIDVRDKWAFDKTLGTGPAFESKGELAERIRDIHKRVSGS